MGLVSGRCRTADDAGIDGFATSVGGRENVRAGPGRYRRMSRDYEYLTASSETMFYMAMSRLMLRRLTLNMPKGEPRRQRMGLKR